MPSHSVRRRPSSVRLSPPQRTRLPNVVVIGASKSGTTSLHAYLDAHPEIGMSQPKELNFFDHPDCISRLDWYLSHFDPGLPVRGESSPNYSKFPRLSGQPERMRSLVPSAKLIYLVREPISRTLAHWAHNVAAGTESRSVETAMLDPDPRNVYVSASRYATQVSRYLQHFPREQVLILDQHLLRHHRRDALRRVFGFLGVQAEFWTPEFEAELNAGNEQRRLLGVGEVLLRSPPAAVLRRLPDGLRERLRVVARRGLSRRVDRPEPSRAIRVHLERALTPEAQRLRELAGESFETWSI